MNAISLRGDPSGALGASGALPQCRWFTSLRLLAVRGAAELVTGEAETCALLLAGTFDLQGGGTAWQSRGARATPFAGRPVAVFLPPKTPFAARGDGEILLVGARQPPAKSHAEGREGLSTKPLLPMAGSGKSYDPMTGEWRPAETFPDAAESLPPRRIERVQAGAWTVERVFAADYKAATLSVDEVVIPAGATFALRDVPGRPPADELLLFVRAEGTARVVAGTAPAAVVRGDVAFVLPLAGGEAPLAITAEGGPAYVVLAYAGKRDRA